MFLLKLHKISTYIAVWSVFMNVLLGFFALLDDVLRLNILPQSFEQFALFIAFVSGAMAIGSVLISIVLSLYRVSIKD